MKIKKQKRQPKTKGLRGIISDVKMMMQLKRICELYDVKDMIFDSRYL